MASDPPSVWLDPLLPAHEIDVPELPGWRVLRPLRGADPLLGIEQADGAIVGDKFPGTLETFLRATRLKVVARRGAGFDNIDVSAATKCGICVTNTPDAHSISVSEYTLAVVLALRRRLVEADRRLSSGEWAPMELVGSDLAGSVVGVLGLGRIGRRVARLLVACDAVVRGFDPHLAAEARAGLEALKVEVVGSLDDLLPTAQVLTIHVPYLATTRHLVGRDQIARLPAGAFLVNAARGPVVDERAVREALESGQLAGAALDVWDPEPPDPANPLLAMDSVIATPHLAARTRESMARSRLGAILNVEAVIAGRQPHGLVNPEVWPHRRH